MLPTNRDATLCRAVRRARGLTQQTLADYANIDRGDLSRAERGQRPSDRVRYRLAAALDLRPDEIQAKP